MLPPLTVALGGLGFALSWRLAVVAGRESPFARVGPSPPDGDREVNQKWHLSILAQAYAWMSVVVILLGLGWVAVAIAT